MPHFMILFKNLLFKGFYYKYIFYIYVVNFDYQKTLLLIFT